MLEVESDKELLSCNTIVAREATLYLHNIYTASTQYLHNIYTISTQYLHSIYTLTGYEENIVGGGLVVVIGEH